MIKQKTVSWLFIFLFAFANGFTIHPQEPEIELIEVSGVFRRTNELGVFIINDTWHEPLNVESIIETTDHFVLYYSFVAFKIHTFIVTVDETFAGEGYFCGASVWWEFAKIYVYQNINGSTLLVPPAEIDSAGGNFWFFGVFSIDNTRS